MPAKGGSLESWLQYISSVHPHEIELGLERSQRVAANLSLGKTRSASRHCCRYKWQGLLCGDNGSYPAGGRV